MTTRAQRKRKAAETAQANESLRIAKARSEKLDISPEFLDEALESRGIVSLSFNNRGRQGHTSVHAAKVSLDDVGGIRGDTVMNAWYVPKIEEFDVTGDGTISEVNSTANGIDISDTWIKTAAQLQDESDTSQDYEGDIVLTREGFGRLIQGMGNTALAESLRQIDQQVFETPKSE